MARTLHFWQTQALHGKAFEKGLDIVFGLPQAGWQSNVYYPYGAKHIYVDRHQPKALSKDGVAQNIEAKTGAVGKDRELEQLKGYYRKLRDGERVIYITRVERQREMSKEAQQLMTKCAKEFPEFFRVMPMKEKVFQRIFEAGMKAVQKEQQQKLEKNLGKIQARDVPVLAVEQIAKDYLRDIHEGAKHGRPVEIEQLRLMNQILRDMNQAQSRIDRDKADEYRKGLGLRYHESRDVEKFLQQQAKDKEVDRATAIDKVTHELLDRERAELAKATAEVAKRLQMDRAMARPLDLEKLKQQNLALGNTFGAIQKMETDLFKDMAKDLPAKDAQSWLRGMELVQSERDEKTRQEIDKLAEVARKEERARAEREAAEKERRTLDQQRQAALERVARDGVPADIVKLLALGQAQPPSVAVERGPDGAPTVERGGRDAIGRARGQQRER